MKRFFLLIKIRYIDRIARYRTWRKSFLKSGWDKKFSRSQAWRQSAWYDPDTGRSVRLIEELYAPKKIKLSKMIKRNKS